MTMHVFLIAAITADGFIARDENQISTSWTSKADRMFFSERTKKAGVVVMGSKTYRTVGRPLPQRLNIVYTQHVQENQENLRFTSESPKNVIDNLEKEGFSEVAICGGSSIYTLFLQAGVVNSVYLTVEPVFFGKGITLSSEELNVKLHLKKTEKISEDTLLLEYDLLSPVAAV